MEINRSLVMKSQPQAFCAHLRGDRCQIHKPRSVEDKRSNLDYVSLSGRFSNEVLAWKDAARRINEEKIINPDIYLVPLPSSSVTVTDERLAKIATHNVA